MIFKSDAQLRFACIHLTNWIQPGLWTDDGISEYGLTLGKSGALELSSGERVLFLLAYSLWSDERVQVNVRDLLLLDEQRRQLVGSFVLALESSEAMDEWIKMKTLGK